MVSGFNHTISSPEFVVSSIGPTPSYWKDDSAALASSTPFNVLDLAAECGEFGAVPFLQQAYPGLRDLDSGGWSLFPVTYLGPLPAKSYYENLATASLPAAYAASGQLLNKYELALAALQETLKKVQQAFDLDAWAARLKRQADTPVTHRQKRFNYQEIIDLIEVAQVRTYTSERAYVLSYISYEKRIRKARRRVSYGVQLIKRLLRRPTSRFCGISWSRRFWFLLHGSHPPKTESWPVLSQEFGCA